MSSSGVPKGKPLKESANPYMAEVKRHPQELRKVDGVLVREDVRGPKKEGDVMARLEEVEHEVFRSEEHTSELQSHYSISYAVFCLKKIFF